MERDELIATLSSLFLRLGLAYIFIWSGINKVFIQSTAPDYLLKILDKLPFLSWTMPLPLGILELTIGFFILMGLFTRISAIIQSLMLLTFIILVLIFVPSGFNIIWKDIALLLASISLAIVGCKYWGIDQLLRRE